MTPARLGMLTPSSNTVLEPLTGRMLAQIPSVSAHFARFRVTEIALSDAATAQFDAEPILAAADLLADARPDVITWNGTSASWLGFERDEALCAQIETRAGVRACTAVLGFRDALAAAGARRIGLVTPYTTDVQSRIAATWARQGFDIIAERHAGLSENFAFARLSETAVADMMRAVAADGPDAVAVVCTNMLGAAVAPQIEAETGVLALDSVAVALWASMRAASAPAAALAPWGRLFADPAFAP